MKEIYFVESSYNPTAASTNRLFALGSQLVKRGFKVHFFYLIPDANHSVSDRFVNVFEFHYLWNKNSFKNKYLCTISSIYKLRTMMRPGIPVYVYSLLNCLFFIKKRGIHVFHEYTENPEVIGLINNIYGKINWKLYGKAVSTIDGLFVITPALKRYYENHFQISSDKIEVLNMVVDPERFDDYIGIKRDNIITYCGIISERKDGISYLIKSFDIVHRAFPNYQLRIVGSFENKETENAVMSLINELSLDSNIQITGPISPQKMPQLLCSSKILALARPNEKGNSYGFATKIGEYLMSEVPVVMTNVGNVTDYLTNGKDIILAEPNNIQDFSDKLLWVINNYAEAVCIGREGRKTAIRYFNPKYEAEKIIKRVFEY